MTKSLSNQSRVTARLPLEVKNTLQKAADLRGSTLNQFIIQAALKEATAVINTENVIHLAQEDAERIFSLIENPPLPNQNLQKAIQQHQIFFREANSTPQ